jgi:hypothetical protein
MMDDELYNITEREYAESLFWEVDKIHHRHPAGTPTTAITLYRRHKSGRSTAVAHLTKDGHLSDSALKETKVALLAEHKAAWLRKKQAQEDTKKHDDHVTFDEWKEAEQKAERLRFSQTTRGAEIPHIKAETAAEYNVQTPTQTQLPKETFYLPKHGEVVIFNAGAVTPSGRDLTGRVGKVEYVDGSILCKVVYDKPVGDVEFCNYFEYADFAPGGKRHGWLLPLQEKDHD